MQEKKTIKNSGGGGVGGGEPEAPPTNALFRFEAEAKTVVFNVIYTLLKDLEISLNRYVFFLLLEFLQMVQFSFSSCVSASKGLICRWSPCGRATAYSTT